MATVEPLYYDCVLLSRVPDWLVLWSMVISYKSMLENGLASAAAARGEGRFYPKGDLVTTSEDVGYLMEMVRTM